MGWSQESLMIYRTKVNMDKCVSWKPQNREYTE